MAKLLLKHRSKGIFNPAFIDFASRRDNGNPLRNKRKQRQDRLSPIFLPDSIPRLIHLFPGNNKRDHTHPRKLVSFSHFRIAVAGSDHHLSLGIDLVKSLFVHFKKTVHLCSQLNLSLACPGCAHITKTLLLAFKCRLFSASSLAELPKNLSTLILVEHPFLRLPDVKILFPHTEQHRNILLCHDVTFLKNRALCLAFDNLCNIMAQDTSNGIFCTDYFHVLSLSSLNSYYFTKPYYFQKHNDWYKYSRRTFLCKENPPFAVL